MATDDDDTGDDDSVEPPPIHPASHPDAVRAR